MHPSTHLLLCVSVFLAFTVAVFLPGCLTVCLSLSLTLCLYLSVCLLLSLSLCLCLSVCLSLSLSLRPSLSGSLPPISLTVSVCLSLSWSYLSLSLSLLSLSLSLSLSLHPPLSLSLPPLSPLSLLSLSLSPASFYSSPWFFFFERGIHKRAHCKTLTYEVKILEQRRLGHCCCKERFGSRRISFFGKWNNFEVLCVYYTLLPDTIVTFLSYHCESGNSGQVDFGHGNTAIHDYNYPVGKTHT